MFPVFFVLFCFVLFCFVLFCFVLFCFVLFCFVLFCFVLFCFGLVFFILVFMPPSLDRLQVSRLGSVSLAHRLRNLFAALRNPQELVFLYPGYPCGVCLHVWIHHDDPTTLYQLQAKIRGSHAMENFYVQGFEYLHRRPFCLYHQNANTPSLSLSQRWLLSFNSTHFLFLPVDN